jgi:hypothetical protein
MSKIDTIRKKTDEISAEITTERQKHDAHEAGFEDYADYELWLALDALRRATIERRVVRRDTRPLVVDSGPLVTANTIHVSKLIDAGRL